MKKTAKTEQLQIRLTREQKLAIKRLATDAGGGVSEWVLKTLLPKSSLKFKQIISELAKSECASHAFAALNDFLTSLTRVEFKSAVKENPCHKLSILWSNQVAAMVEQRAHQLELSSPE